MNNYPILSPNTEENRTELLRVITRERTNDISIITQIQQNLNNGYTRNTGEISLATGTTTTVVPHSYVRSTSTVSMIPTTQNASLEMTSGNFWVTCADEAFTINHTNNGLTDRTFRYVVFGI